ncbi:PREDICTED: DNA cross-link repair 1A protein-like [Amphimedon queenslandica]|uniref:DNA cross-link repair 1A protein n=1 Tax=Amphimedon queenslandica TaxID=400682 RepID=A0A1X7VNF7_AMPQE|nr:PREDICTED: DNA cross-link repair 1A protein-like [Amphimedon queenslandica]|eukprot:XP_019859070.1 PREDICTED: DNA cross-link repair 1A protein-like [Amphimedon queenslandica]
MASQSEAMGETKKRLSLSRKRKRSLNESGNEDKSSRLCSVVYEVCDSSKSYDLGSNSSNPVIILSDSGDEERDQKSNSSLPSLRPLAVSPIVSNYSLVSPSSHSTVLSLLRSPAKSTPKNQPLRKKKDTLLDHTQMKLDTFFQIPKRLKTLNAETINRSKQIKNERNSTSKFTPLLTRPTIGSVPKRRVKREHFVKPSTTEHAGKHLEHKWIPDTSITVDAFSYGSINGCTSYFLTHFHSDHYAGLNSRFAHDIYCSKVTGNLIIQELKVKSDIVHPLPLKEEKLINGVQVTLLDANHCPGSVLLLFKLPSGKVILHTGDFRLSHSMIDHNFFLTTPIDTLFLDTTYCSARYDFPPQDDVISFVVNIVLERMVKDPDTLIVCGAYTIGKEKIFTAIANSLGCQCYVSKERYKILQCLESKEIMSVVNCHSPLASPIHVMSLNKMNVEELTLYLRHYSTHYTSILAFKPTGWTATTKHNSLQDIRPVVRGVVTMYGVPYSEHSSFSELRTFVQSLSPQRVISTVGGATARRTAESQCAKWIQERCHGNKGVKVQATLDKFRKN